MAGVTDAVARYYASKLAVHGPTPRGVDWNTAESQELRFRQLLTVCGADRDASILDFGCGYGALAPTMRRLGFTGEYTGYDIAPEMVTAATEAHRLVPRCRFTADAVQLRPADYTLASGIFNVRLDVPAAAWEAYVRDTLDSIAGWSVRGFAFNLLTQHADADRMRGDLYYGDPGAWLNYCLQRFSRHAALLHDYGLFEFTLVVRTTPSTHE